MAQFDVYRVRGGSMVVDCQSNLMSDLPTRLVVPLRPRDNSAMKRLTPVFEIDEHEFIMVTPLTRAISRRDILGTVTSLAEREYDIKAALDLLISGF